MAEGGFFNSGEYDIIKVELAKTFLYDGTCLYIKIHSFFTGRGDEVICFHCGGGLRFWLHHDNV
jgi:hypothetical protein